MVDLLFSLPIILGFGPEDIWDEGLWIAVVEREPAGLHLNHNAVAGQKNVVCGWQGELVEEGLAGGDWLGVFEALAVAAAEDVGGDHELVAPHLWLAGYFVGVDVDDFDDPVGVGSAGGGDEIGDGLAADLYRSGEGVGGEDGDVSAPGGFALVVGEPVWPGQAVVVTDGLDGTGAEGYWFRGVGDVGVEAGVFRLRCGEAEFAFGSEVERRGG